MDLSAAEGRRCPCECVAAREIAAIISGRAADVLVVQAAARAMIGGVLAQRQVGARGMK